MKVSPRGINIINIYQVVWFFVGCFLTPLPGYIYLNCSSETRSTVYSSSSSISSVLLGCYRQVFYCVEFIPIVLKASVERKCLKSMSVHCIIIVPGIW